MAEDSAKKAAAPAPNVADRFPASVARDAAVRNALAQGGDVPTSVEHIGNPNPDHKVVFPDFSPKAPRPRGLWFQATTYAIPEREIFASSEGRRVTSYTFDSTTVGADGDGNKIVMEGTVVALNGDGTMLQPRISSYDAVGVLGRRINLRDGDLDVPLVLAGVLREDRCWDDGNFGAVDSGAKTDLAATGILFSVYDI